MKMLVKSVALALTVCASTAAADVESCVAGSWWADISDIADMMALQMGGAARATGGDIRMDVQASGSFRITVRDLSINVRMPDAPAVDVTISGYSAGTLDAAENVWNAFVGDYNMVGVADVLGRPLTIPYTSASGMFGGGLGWFDCNSTLLRFETDPSRPVQMVRSWRRG